MKKLREKVLQIAKIAQECPDNLQQICFEILLKHSLSGDVSRTTETNPQVKKTGGESDDKHEPQSVLDNPPKTQDDLSDTDLHVKVRRFLEKCTLDVKSLNQLFYKEDGQVLPLYENLKTTRTSENQIRITLLQCLQNAITSGDFQTNVEAAREEAIARKCYDNTNWAANYTNNATWFDFDKYSKQVKDIGLSDEGKTKLADVIKELQ